MSFRSDRLAQEIDAQFRRGIADQWWETCRGARVGLYFDTPTGTTEVLPTVTRVHDSRSFAVELPPGMIVDDLRKSVRRLAAGMGVPMMRFTETARPLTVGVQLLAVDPLAGTVAYPVPVPHSYLGFGVDETGDVVSCPLDEWTHTAIQGSTGSGKSVAGYNLLAQLYGFGPLVDVVGIDPTGSLLGPWGPHPRGWRVTGTKDAAERYPAVLRALCDDMDDRIGEIPPRCDTLPTGPVHPLRVVVLGHMRKVRPPQVAQSKRQASRQTKWDARNSLQEVTTMPRLKACGQVSMVDGGEVEVRRGDGSAAYAGLVTCGSVWMCPVCSSKIARERAEELTRLMEWNTARGGSVALMTLTMRHFRGQRLRELRRALTKAWAHVTASRGWKHARKQAGMDGYVRATEAT